MTVVKVCATERQFIGSLACTKVNPFVDAVTLILTTPDFEFDSFADFADAAIWEAGIKAGKIIPITDIVEIEDQSEETQYYEAPNGSRTPRRLGRYRHMYNFNKGLEVHKALQSYRNADLNLITVDDANNVMAYSPDGVKVKGMTIDMINPEKMKSAGQDNTPAWTPLSIDLKNGKEWNEKGVYVNPDWDATSLEGIAPVEISVLTQTAALVVLKVAYFEGLESDGSENLVGVGGIVEGDFVFDTIAPAGPMVDNGDGTYDFPGAAMVSGTVDLKPASTAASGGSPIQTNGVPVAITIA